MEKALYRGKALDRRHFEHRGSALDRRHVGTKHRRPRAPGPVLWVDGRRDDGKSIGLEREGDLTLAASFFCQAGFPGRPTVTPIDDDLDMVLGTKRRPESGDEVPTPERLAGDDAQASRLSCHQGFRVTRIVSPTQIRRYGLLAKRAPHCGTIKTLQSTDGTSGR